MDFDTKILNYIEEKGLVRTGQLVKHFTEDDFKENVSEGVSLKKDKEAKPEKSERTILRKLKKMAGKRQIVILNSEQVKMYGIEGDGRAKYVTLMEAVGREKYLDKIFERLSTGDDIEKEMVLEEIKKYQQKYLLSPSQLDVLVLNLDSENREFIEKSLEILQYYVIKREVNPKDKNIFLEKLRNLLEQYAERYENISKVRVTALELLAYYKDEAIIGQLKKYFELGTLGNHVSDHTGKFTRKFIEEKREELFDMELELRRKGETETADILAVIRR